VDKVIMEVGDMVEIAFHVTQRGLPEEKHLGLIVEIKEIDFDQKDRREIAVVNFCGSVLEYPVSHLRIVSKLRTRGGV
jgi:hypothetical protein